MTPEKLRKEQKFRGEIFALLDELEDFEKLSPKQQQLVQLSFYVQDRKRRGSYKEYPKSILAVLDTNCHLAAFYLENQMFPGKEPTDLELQHFHQTRVIVDKNLSFEELSARIERTGLPCLVILGQKRDDGDKFSPDHSFIIFRDRKGTLKTWEKRGYVGEYQMNSFTERYNDSGSYQYRDVYWGMRRLKTSQTV